MNASFHTGNRKRLYEAMKPASLLVMFSGEDVRKTNDEYYPFYTDRNFYYLTGLDQHELVLMAVKEPSGNVHEQIYILPPDLMAERWTGARLKPAEVEALSGISDVRFVDQFQTDFHALAAGGHYSLTSGQIAQVYLDLFRVSPQDIAARRIGCSDSWVYKLVAAGELQAYRIGSRKGVQITVRSIDAYIDRKAVKPDKA